LHVLQPVERVSTGALKAYLSRSRPLPFLREPACSCSRAHPACRLCLLRDHSDWDKIVLGHQPCALLHAAESHECHPTPIPLIDPHLFSERCLEKMIHGSSIGGPRPGNQGRADKGEAGGLDFQILCRMHTSLPEYVGCARRRPPGPQGDGFDRQSDRISQARPSHSRACRIACPFNPELLEDRQQDGLWICISE